MNRTLDEVLAKVRGVPGRLDSLIADRAALKEQVAKLIAAQGQMSEAMQAGLNEIFDTTTADAQKIEDALNANPPVAA